MASLRFNRGHHATRSNSVSSARDAANNPAASSSSSSSAASTSGASKTSDGIKFVQKYLDQCRSFYSCIYCRTHLANHDELISRSFQGNRSRAYLFNTVINVSCGPSVQRELNTGSHSVADIFCANCGTTIGWKYERAFVDSQKYKEGKYIIELAHVVRENRHLELDKRDLFLGLANAPPKHRQQSSLAAPSIGTSNQHQGSLSPTSTSGQWSPGTSSSSSSSSSPSSAAASPSPNANAATRPSCRYSLENSQTNSGDQQTQQRRPAVGHCDEEDSDGDEIDDDEVLMFPFYDDLYGNRASYSSLTTSRSHQKRLRRSLHLEALPYDWRCSRPSGSGSSFSSNVSPMATSSSPRSLQQPNLTSCSSSSIQIPVGQSNEAQLDGSGHHQAPSARRFFAGPAANSPPTCPPQPSTSQAATATAPVATSSAVGRANTARNTSEPKSNLAASSSSDRPMAQDEEMAAEDDNEEEEEDDDDDTQFQFEHDKPTADNEHSPFGQSQTGAGRPTDYHAQLGANRGGAPTTPSGSGGSQSPVASGSRWTPSDQRTQLAGDKKVEVSEMCVVQEGTRTNSQSFDDEEFYDCNTDHDVSNSSFKPK